MRKSHEGAYWTPAATAMLLPQVRRVFYRRLSVLAIMAMTVLFVMFQHGAIVGLSLMYACESAIELLTIS